jgi:hypothetical protein
MKKLIYIAVLFLMFVFVGVAEANVDNNLVFKKLSKTNLRALTAYAEARSENYDGIVAVLTVIENRKAQSNKSYHHIILAPFQFSPFNFNDKQRLKLEEIARHWQHYSKRNRSLQTCIVITKGMDSGMIKPNKIIYETGALYFHACSVYPSWAKTMQMVCQVVNHIYYSDRVMDMNKNSERG